MEAKELIEMIDQEIDLHIKRGKKFNVGELVGSYSMKDEYKPVVKQYVTDVQDLFSTTIKKAGKGSALRGIGCLGEVISTSLGAVTGATIGYFSSGWSKAGEFAIWGAGIGVATEFLLRPSGIVLIACHYSSEIESCKEPRAVYRNRTLSKLEGL